MSNYYLSKRSNPFDLIDPFFDAFWGGNNAHTDVMRTDITDEGDHYQLKIDMPAIAKEDIKISLAEGYLSITATFGDKEDNKDGRYIRRERHVGSYTRSFYVGEEVTEEDLKAKLEEGVLIVSVTKPQPKKKEDKKFIDIE